MSSRTIMLTQGQKAIVSNKDYEWLSQWHWYALWDSSVNSYYAVRNKKRENNYTVVRMHREILGLVSGDSKIVDHRNHNTLDNRRQNLRIASIIESNRNRKRQRNNASGVTGVWLHKRSGLWLAQIKINGKHKYLGSRKNKREAVDLRNAAEKMYFGEFACLR